MDKAIAKVNQNEFNRYENLFNTVYVVSQRHYPHLVATGRNRLTTWTEKSVGTFFSSCGTVALMVLGHFSDICGPCSTNIRKLAKNPDIADQKL
jgi:hypothetical protein